MGQYELLKFLKKKPNKVFTSFELSLIFPIQQKTIAKQLNRLVSWGFIEKYYSDTNKPYYKYVEVKNGLYEEEEKPILQ